MEFHEGLRVWVGAIKLDNRFPEKAAIQQFLYGAEDNSAEDADIVALYFTDLELNESTADDLRHGLRAVMRNADDYIFNSEDPGIGIKGVPASIVKIAEH